MEAVCSSETLVNTYKTTWRHKHSHKLPEDNNTKTVGLNPVPSTIMFVAMFTMLYHQHFVLFYTHNPRCKTRTIKLESRERQFWLYYWRGGGGGEDNKWWKIYWK
jgi:hypothetical protein